MRYAVLLGPPNSGKSTLFNHLTEQHSSVINYPGSTTEVYIAKLKNHSSVSIIDSPGIQSLLPRSDDEKLALKTITKLDSILDSPHALPDLIICVIDSTQSDRHLAITKRLIDDGYPVIVVFTMVDDAIKKGIEIDHVNLSKALGVSTFKVNAKKQDDLNELSNGIIINSVPCGRITNPKPASLDDMIDSYEWAKNMMAKHQHISKKIDSFDLDSWLLHPVLGYGFFIASMIGMFCVLFFLASPFMTLIEVAFDFFGESVGSLIKNEPINNFLVNGLIAGLGGVVIFVPQIVLLFFGLGIMESSGFLARSAVLIDKPLSKIGLNGRSFVPLLSGCACAIPAILATRVISNKRVRMLTMMAIPLMQCTARLPVYGLLLAVLFDNALAVAIGLTSIYLLSLIVSAIIIGIANYVSFPKGNENEPFIMELPEWRWPSWRQLIKDTKRKTSKFLTDAGPIIFSISIILWGLAEIQWQETPLIYHIGQWIEPIFKPMGVNWQVGVAILLSFAAREVFVSALAIVYQTSEQALLNMTSATNQSIHTLFDTGAAIGLILFFMVAMQCGATFVVLKKEMGQYRTPSIILITFIVIAYFLAITANAIF